ncbi:MAG: hypothetical protein LBU83_08475 [Bacteroidales bacterium]|jgi:hypothetical protein|nr:hypothetical protein [Bacteroidales bacterium]
MKRFLFIFTLVFSVLCLNAQKNIFVLVDVSKSVKSYQLDNAKIALKDIFTTGTVNNGTVVGGNLADLHFYKLQANDKVAVNAFGDLQTSANIIPILKTVNDPINDIDNILNSIVWLPRDNWTYLTLARAKIAEFAKKRGINDYLLIEITDNVNDDYGPNGTANYQGKTYLEDLITQYNTTTNKVTDNGWTKIAFGSDKKFLLSLTSGVSISTYTPPVFQPIRSGITITFPSQTKKGAELEINDESFTLTWACVKCKPDLEYSVHIEGYDGNTYTNHIDAIKTESIPLKLTQNGMYQIVVSASDCNLVPDTAFIKLNIVKDTKIKITSPVGTSKKPNEIKGEKVNISWRCPDCDENTTFTVSISGTDGTKMKDKQKPIKTKNFSVSINGLSSGKYRITVSGTNGASSDTTFIEVRSDGAAGWLLILLLLIGAGIGIYFIVKKMGKKPPIQTPSNNNYNDNQKTSNNNNSNVETSDDGMF